MDGTPVEIEDNKIDGNHDNEEAPERNLRRKGKPEDGCYDSYCDAAIEQLVCAFAV